MIPEIDKDIIQMFYELVKNNWRSIYNTPECPKKTCVRFIG